MGVVKRKRVVSPVVLGKKVRGVGEEVDDRLDRGRGLGVVRDDGVRGLGQVLSQ